MGVPGARCCTASGLAIANVLGTCVQLNCGGFDPAYGLVAVAAACIMHRSQSLKKVGSQPPTLQPVQPMQANFGVGGT